MKAAADEDAVVCFQFEGCFRVVLVEGVYTVGGIKTNGQVAVCVILALLLVISLVHLPKKAK